MAKLDPWSYAEKTRNEHAEQVALFMWANMAKMFGKIIADSPLAYNQAGWAKEMAEIHAGNPGMTPITELKWLHAVHNQGHGDAIRGMKAKAEGVKAGVADIFLPMPINTQQIAHGFHRYAGLYIELKKKDSGKPHAEQLDFQTDMRAAGYKAEIIHGWQAARDEILAYLGR